MSGQGSTSGSAGAGGAGGASGSSVPPVPKNKSTRKYKKIKFRRSAKKNAKIERATDTADLEKEVEKLSVTNDEREPNLDGSEEKKPDPKEEKKEPEEKAKADTLDKKGKKKRYRKKKNKGKKNSEANKELEAKPPADEKTNVSNMRQLLALPQEPKAADSKKKNVCNTQRAPTAPEEPKPSTSGTNKLSYSEVVKPFGSQAPAVVPPGSPEYARPALNVWDKLSSDYEDDDFYLDFSSEVFNYNDYDDSWDENY